MIATASAAGGRVLVHLCEAHIKGLELPAVVRTDLERPLQQQLDQSLQTSTAVVQLVLARVGMLVRQRHSDRNRRARPDLERVSPDFGPPPLTT